MSPMATDPIVVLVYPGLYSDALTLVSNVSLVGAGQLGAIVSGVVSWQAGVGVNAPQVHQEEKISFTGLFFDSPSITLNTTTKTDVGFRGSFGGFMSVMTFNNTFNCVMRNNDFCSVASSFVNNVSSNGETTCDNREADKGRRQSV